MDAGWTLWPIALLMALLVAALVRWSAETRTVVAASVVVFLLVMMVAMFVGTAIYFTWPGPRSLVLGLWTAAALMAVSVFPVFLLIYREARDHQSLGLAYTPRPITSLRTLAVVVTLLVLGAELLMGRSFALADGGSRSVSFVSGLLATLASRWFLFPMAGEMAFTFLWLRSRLPVALQATLGAQAGMMFFALPALPGAIWLIGSGVVTAGLMSALLGYLVWRAYRGTAFGRGVRGYIIRFLLVTAGLGMSLAFWLETRDLVGFALATVLEMGIFFSAVVVPESFETTSRSLDAAPLVPRPEREPTASP